MKNHAKTLPALAAVIFLTGPGGSTSRAQTWQTILDLGPNTYGYDVLANPFPNSPLPAGVFAAADISGPDNEIVFMDTAQPQSASNPSVVVPSSGLINRLGFDSSSRALYSVGYVRKPDSSLSWDVRGSLDGGLSWSEVDSGWQLSPGASAQATGFAADAAGNLFVGGSATDSKGKGYAVLRTSMDHGTSWTTKALTITIVAAVHFVPVNSQNPGGLFTVGRIGSNFWGVQRSRDGGNTWTTVDSWGVSKSGYTVAVAVTSDAQGNIYVGGVGKKALNNVPYGWYVKMSSDGGDTWQTLLSNFFVGGDSLVNDLTVDGAGNLWVVGGINAYTVNETWTMQRWNQSTGWSDPVYPYANSAPRSRAKGVTSGGGTAGKVYVTGGVFDSAGFTHATLLEITN